MDFAGCGWISFDFIGFEDGHTELAQTVVNSSGARAPNARTSRSCGVSRNPTKSNEIQIGPPKSNSVLRLGQSWNSLDFASYVHPCFGFRWISLDFPCKRSSLGALLGRSPSRLGRRLMSHVPPKSVKPPQATFRVQQRAGKTKTSPGRSSFLTDPAPPPQLGRCTCNDMVDAASTMSLQVHRPS